MQKKVGNYVNGINDLAGKGRQSTQFLVPSNCLCTSFVYGLWVSALCGFSSSNIKKLEVATMKVVGLWLREWKLLLR